MDRIWAPWRGQYVRDSAGDEPGSRTCFLCRGLQQSNDKSNFLVWRRAATVVYLNRFPYNTGHLLVAPVVHKGSLCELQGSELVEPLETLSTCIKVLDRILRPHGYNVGLNLGRSAGAGVPDHLHWHLVPRWDGDTNFMPVLSTTKVLVESLEEFYERFAPEFANQT